MASGRRTRACASIRWVKNGFYSMASDRWKQGEAAQPDEAGKSTRGPVPEFVRRALTAGFSGFFLTGETLREALGDSVPKEWADFAAEQSSRARSEFFERLSAEMGRAVENVDWAEVISTLLQGRAVEVNARIRLGEADAEGRPTLRLQLADDED